MKRPLLGLIGEQIAHSLTPAMQEAAGRAVGFDIRYHLIDSHMLGYGEQDLVRVLRSARLLGFTGINVTHPFKQAVMDGLDTIETNAQKIGAVNTVVIRQNCLIGHNTDYSGFISGWRQVLGQRQAGVTVLVGAGGVGRAIAQSLTSLGISELRIVDIDVARSRALADAFRLNAPDIPVAPHTDVAAALLGADGVVNATPIGMYTHPGTPIPEHALKGLAWATDAIYAPMETQFIAAARRAGAAVMTGQELAIGQAIDAFTLFFDRAAPQEVMRDTFLANLEVASLRSLDTPNAIVEHRSPSV